MGIHFETVTYAYKSYGRSEKEALAGVDLLLATGRFISILGAPGSGKSTLLQLCNGLLRPTSGQVHVLDFVIRATGEGGRLKRNNEPRKRGNELRKRVGLVFQFPERQMFAETIVQDLSFGPLQCGMTPEEAHGAAKRAAAMLGLDEDVLARSPFTLSGGQLRKAAIASVLAMDPEVFILDEPTASLDQVSREQLMNLLHRLCKQEGKTVIVVTHRSDEVLPYADDIVVLEQGKLLFHGSASEMFLKRAELTRHGIVMPAPIRLAQRLKERFGIEIPPHLYRPEDIADAIAEQIGGKSYE